MTDASTANGRGSPAGSTGLITETTRIVGAIHLALAGVVNAVLGGGLLYLWATNRTGEILVSIGPSVTSEAELLHYGGLVHAISIYVAPAIGVGIVGLALYQLWSGRAAYRGTARRHALAASIVGCVTVLAIPLCAIAVTALAVSGDQFRADRRGDER